jgi:putative PD-(D/E)XK family protein DUF4420
VSAVRGRHLSVPILLEHVGAGTTIAYRFPGTPAVQLLIEGALPRLTLSTGIEQPASLPPNPLRHIAVTSGVEDGEHRLSVSVAGGALLLDGHTMLCAIADRIQLEGRPPAEAVTETLAGWRSVLAARTRMSPEAEVGLFGELLVLEALAADDPETNAWRGALHEEHDFGLAATDVEVKTTSMERREHWISGLEQLTPTGQRPLLLVSIQITRGGASGRTLPELITDVRALSGPTGELDAKLQQLWDDETADLFGDRWRLRSAPRAYTIDGRFPTLTRDVLAGAISDINAVRDVHYRLDLHDRPADHPADAQLTAALLRLTAELA